MMTGSVYATVGFTCAIVCMILFRCNRELFASKAENGLAYFGLLTGCTVFGIVDGTWGLLDAKTIDLGVTGFYIVSFLFHFLSLLAVAGWFVFISIFFNKKQKRIVKIFESIPLICALALLVMQFFNECIFYIDSDCVYHTGEYRKYLFLIQLFYLLFAFAKGMYLLNQNKNNALWEHRFIVFEFCFLPIAACIMQMLFPNGPYYSIGIILTSVVIFNGIIVIDNTREKGRYEIVSKETYKALEALCSGFLSVHLFDLRINRQTQVKSSIFIDVLANKADNAHEQIISVMDGICTDEHREEMIKFVDTYTLDERMQNKKSISRQFEGKVSGWCISTFIAVERDEEGKLTKVIHAVQSIDETKRKEMEYSEAIKRAYENKNVIYGEIVKMQSVGMIATDETEQLILANDVAADMFGCDSKEIEGMSFVDFWGNAVFEEEEQATEKFERLKKTGGQFTYEARIPREDENEQDRYITADIKRVDLMDGSKVMVTCFTDITKRKLLENKLRNLSDIDGLTGIANRRCGEKQMHELLRDNAAGLFCLMDVNDFKSINDTYGHKIGDDALREMAAAIKKSFRSDDVIMRLGGDEFAVFAKSVSSTGLARTKIERLFENIENIRIESMGDNGISVSLGAVLIDENSSELEYLKLYSVADEAMYSCKGKPGNNMSIVQI